MDTSPCYFATEEELAETKEEEEEEEEKEEEEEEEEGDEIHLEITVDSGAAMSTNSLRQWRQIEQSVTGEEWKQIEDRKMKTDSKFRFGRGEIIKVEIVGLLPIRVAGSFLTLKMNVIYDDIPLLLGIKAIEKLKVTLDFPNNQMWTPEKRVYTNQIGGGTSNMEVESKQTKITHEVKIS